MFASFRNEIFILLTFFSSWMALIICLIKESLFLL